jgi:hypothetical protein
VNFSSSPPLRALALQFFLAVRLDATQQRSAMVFS